VTTGVPGHRCTCEAEVNVASRVATSKTDNQIIATFLRDRFTGRGGVAPS
jgi:hypothetical protein